MFVQIYSPTFPPPSGVRTTHERRLCVPGYPERLTAMYTGTILTQPQIIAILSQEFQDCSISLSSLKRDLKALGLRRYKRLKSRDLAGSSGAPSTSNNTWPGILAASNTTPVEKEKAIEHGSSGANASSPAANDLQEDTSLGSPASWLSGSSFSAMETGGNPPSLMHDLFPGAIEFSDFLSEEFTWDSDNHFEQQ